MTNTKIIGAIIVMAILAAAKFIFWDDYQAQILPKNTVQTVCDLTTNGCPFSGSATIRLVGISDAKQPFSIIATGVPENVKNLSVSFTMRDMDMGFNRVDLQRQSDGSWVATKVYLPFCAANRQDWLMQWTMDGQHFQAAFHTK